MNSRTLQFLTLLVCLRQSSAGDWPTYRKDTGRTGITDESLSFPMKLKWRYTCAQVPLPAWPDPPRLYNKMDFDFAPHPVVAEGRVYICSNSDDTMRVLDAHTGKQLWRFTAGGPLRFAPQAYKSRVYLSSDDAHIHCLDSQTGKPIWEFNAAPENEMFIGNGRMISRWPIRTGILVEADVLYAVAGMWPSEGIYVYALDAETGKVIWVNDRDGLVGNYASGMWRPQDPHSGEFSFTGPTPQGALVTSRDTLIVPLGNNSSAAYTKKAGGLLRFIGKGSGSSNIVRDGNMFYSVLFSRSGISIFGGRAADRGVKNRANWFKADKVPQISSSHSRRAGVRHSKGRISFLVQNGKLLASESFSLAMSGDTLLEGRLNSIAALEKVSRREIWSAPVDGEAREIAIADGCVYVSTGRGEISSFASSDVGDVHFHRESTGLNPDIGSKWKHLADGLAGTQSGQGYALILGASDIEMAVALATWTGLKIVQVVSDIETAIRFREELLSSTSLYGSRIHVININDSTKLPFAKFFANAVIVAGPVSRLEGNELYRALRPYGGALFSPGLDAAEAGELVRRIRPTGDESKVTRILGKPGLVREHLKGARNWNRNTNADQRVRWPLRPIWFGGPDASLVKNYGIGSHPPVAANGRYFVMGQNSLTAVDAYTGAELWTRLIPSATPNIRAFQGLNYQIEDGPSSSTNEQWSVLKRWLAADGESVYLRLGENYFKEKGEALFQIDALNGQVTKVIAPVLSGPTITLKEPQRWKLEVDPGQHGTLSLSTTDDGIRLDLSAVDTHVTPVDAWDLFFDFRPPAERYGLYGQGTFMVTVSPGEETEQPKIIQANGSFHPKIQLRAKRDSNKWLASLLLKWKELTGITPERPTSFAFGATFNAYNGPVKYKKRTSKGEVARVRDSVRQLYLFSDANSPTLNVGWANVVLDKGGEQTQPSVVSETILERPKDWPWPDFYKDVYVGDPGRIDALLREKPRRHPLTGETGPRIFRTGTAGCGNPVFSSTNAIGRTSKQALGFYDFEDDSGLRFFPGIATNCGARVKAINMTAALGLLIFSDSRSHCSCMIPIRTSMAFAPAERRLQEDWAIFFERGLDAPLKHAFLNLGAFGDRRDDEGRLWLKAPRQAAGRAYPVEPGTRRWIFDAPPMKGTLDVPVEIVREPKVRGGAYRANADRVRISGTDRPWIYTSGYRGIVSLNLKMLPVLPVASKALDEEPTVDGRFDEIRGDEKPDLKLSFTGTEVFIRHTPENLYLAARRKPIVGRRGAIVPWTAKAKAEDDVFTDDCFEVFFSDKKRRSTIHLAVSASGARYDAFRGASDPPLPGQWSMPWSSKSLANNDGLFLEIAIPWRSLKDAGLDRESLQINLQANQQDIGKDAPYWPGSQGRVAQRIPGISEPLLSLGPEGRAHCAHFVALGWGKTPTIQKRSFTVRMHFAELKQIEPGHRVFDVELQGKTVLKDFDIVKEAGGVRRALVREFRNVEAGQSLSLKFISPLKRPVIGREPMISALEVIEE